MKSETRIPFFIIWKHLTRGNKWTLMFIILLIAAAFINLVFINSLLNGVIRTTNQQTINTYAGNITIMPGADRDYIDNSDKVVEKIEGVNGVTAASAKKLIPATLKYKNIKGNWQTFAINPSNEKEVTSISSKMISGSYLDQNDADSIIIGRQIAGGSGVELDALSFKGAQVGDKVNLSINGLEKDFTIKGIFYTQYIFSDQFAFISEKAADEMMPQYLGKANSITIKINQEGQENTVIERLKEAGIDERFYTWEEMSGIVDSISGSFLTINVILTIVGLIIAAVTIFIVIYIDISNKRQQIGILRAIGIKAYLIRSAHVLQTVVYAILGLAMGSLIYFAAIVPYFLAHPFSIPIGDVTLVYSWEDFLFRSEAVIIVAIISGLIPSILITRIKLLDAIWGK